MDCIDRANLGAFAAAAADILFDVSLSVSDLNCSFPANTHTCFTSIASILIYYSRHLRVLLSCRIFRSVFLILKILCSRDYPRETAFFGQASTQLPQLRHISDLTVALLRMIMIAMAGHIL